MTASEKSLHSLLGIYPLSHLGVIEAQGADAAQFLHNQLTQDLLLLKAPGARLAAFCSAQGRVLASFIVIKVRDDRILLVINKDLLAPTLKRLSMFVLRAKVKLVDASNQYHLRGVIGVESLNSLGDPLKLALNDQDAQASPWHCVQAQDASVVSLYPAVYAKDSQQRWLWIAPVETASPVPTSDDDLWQWSEVLSGVTLMNQAVFEAFVPQMINYESVGGVNFKKGCYPGQEVVARSQFRGTLKRRMAIVHSPVALTSGQEIFSCDDLTQPCGKVVLCAKRPSAAPSGGYDALISGTLQSMESGWVSSAQDGHPLEFMPLPYPLLEDI